MWPTVCIELCQSREDISHFLKRLEHYVLCEDLVLNAQFFYKVFFFFLKV